MNIWNKKIKDLSYNDIVEFCKLGEIEGIELDYKKDLSSSKGLAKHFAAFSNTRGGLIIIGVEEDKSGKPSVYEGVIYESKFIDQIHQYASLVDPIPAYEVFRTDEVNGKVFILIRIFEGDKTPYYKHNDSNIYVRTGNLTNLIDIASVEAQENLFNKRIQASRMRQISLKMAENVSEHAIYNANSKFVQDLTNKKLDIDSWEEKLLKLYKDGIHNIITYEEGYLKIFLQPYNPKKSLTTPKDIKDSIQSITIKIRGRDAFPAESYNMKTIPEGIYNSHSLSTKYLDVSEIFANGLIYLYKSCLNMNDKGINILYGNNIISEIYVLLNFAKNFYHKFNYTGVLKGEISLLNVKNSSFRCLSTSRAFNYSDYGSINVLLPEYKWEIEFDTSMLFDKERFKKYIFELIEKIHWDLGIPNMEESAIENAFNELVAPISNIN